MIFPFLCGYMACLAISGLIKGNAMQVACCGAGLVICAVQSLSWYDSITKKRRKP